MPFRPTVSRAQAARRLTPVRLCGDPALGREVFLPLRSPLQPGFVPSGWDLGYSWMRDAPSPLVDDTQDNDSSSENVYRRLGGHWYLFYETW